MKFVAFLSDFFGPFMLIKLMYSKILWVVSDKSIFFLKAYFITIPKRYGFLLNVKSLVRK